MYSIKTARLTIRPLNTDDSEFIFRLLNTPGWIEFIGDRQIHSTADAQKYIVEKIHKNYEEFGIGLELVFLESVQKPIGICGLIKRDGLDDLDIGFAFLPEFFGLGYAYEAAKASLDYGFNQLKRNRIVAITTENNIRSRNLLEKIGLVFEKFFFMEGDPDELMLYGLNQSSN